MSFLDQREQRPPPTGARRRSSRGAGADARTLRLRRGLAGAASVAVLVLLVFAIKGCRESARQQSFKDFLSNTSAISDQSNQESRALLALLSKPSSQGPVELQSSVDGYRSDAAALVERARAAGHPAELAGAQRYLVDVLELRRDGIGHIATLLPTALGDAGQYAAASRIATVMQNFVASDVIFAQRVVPNLQGPLQKEGLLAGAPLPQSRFLPDLTWLSAIDVSQRIAAVRAGGAAPGTHRVTLGGVTVKPGGETLTAGTPIQIAATPTLSFDAVVSNQGTVTERDVIVTLTISGGGTPLVVQQRLDSIDAGQQRTVSIPLAATPPIGQQLTLSLAVQPVPGEKDTSSTKASYTASFTH